MSSVNHLFWLKKTKSPYPRLQKLKSFWPVSVALIFYFLFLMLSIWGPHRGREGSHPGVRESQVEQNLISAGRTEANVVNLTGRPSLPYPQSRPYYIVEGRRYYPLTSAEGYTSIGEASWYGDNFHGKKTASGDSYNMFALTAAHKTLPFGTFVKVINLKTFLEVTVRINDRGPFNPDYRIIDLSYAAARRLGLLESGRAPVKLEAIKNQTQLEAERNIKRQEARRMIKLRHKQSLLKKTRAG